MSNTAAVNVVTSTASNGHSMQLITGLECGTVTVGSTVTAVNDWGNKVVGTVVSIQRDEAGVWFHRATIACHDGTTNTVDAKRITGRY